MKKKIIGFLIIVTIMVSIPLLTVKNSAFGDFSRIFQPESKTDSDILCGLLAARYKAEYSDETLRAFAIILNTNYNYNKEKYDLKDKSVFLTKKEFVREFGSKNYSKLEKLCAEKKIITYNGKTARLPFFYLSEGYTDGGKSLPYIKRSACPWDMINAKYTGKERQRGVSINTLNILCKSGMTAEKALGHFLTGVKITAAK